MSTRSTNRRGAHSPGSPRGATSAPRARDGAPRFLETVGPADGSFEREADRIANAVVRGPGAPGFGTAWSAASVAQVGVQRKCAECELEEEEGKQIRRAPKSTDAAETAVVDTPPPAAATATATGEGAASVDANAKSAPAAAVAGLLVEDTGEASGAQMRKTEFLSALRVDVCAAADAAMAGTGRTSEGCPWVDYWLGYYADKDAAHIERALLRYAPEAAGAASARDYIGFAAARVARSVAIWAKTGEISGLPEDLPGAGAAMLGAGAALLFKARSGGPREANPVSVRHELGAGHALPGAVRTRMESAFGVNFSGVRLHDDATGNQLSERLNARAFTVGQHVAFGPGEFRPGTIAGDALIAHELAHVVQQGGASAAAPLGKSAESSGPLEADADRSAFAVASSLWAGGASTGTLAQRVLPSIRSGLRISRCSTDSKMTHTPAASGKGTWGFSQNNSDGSASKKYFSEVKLKFAPEKDKIDCSELAFVQAVRVIDPTSKANKDPTQKAKDRMTPTGWNIDRLEDRKYGWYGFSNGGLADSNVTPGSSPKPLKTAEMSDRPGWTNPSTTWDFETCAICKSGSEVGTVYGCYSWGFDVDASHKLTSHTTAEQASPSAEFADSVKQWNAQAKGPAAKRNDPDQRELGPFK